MGGKFNPAASVLGLSWSQLNSTLLDCKELSTLERWLAEEERSGSLIRALRVYGRLSVVRREQELKALRHSVRTQRAA